MTKDDAVVAIYSSHEGAEQAVQELHRGGFDMKKLSIVGKDYHTEEHVVGYHNAGDRMKYWGKFGAIWGAIFGMLSGAAFFAIPGIGPVVVAGPLVAWIVSALEGAVVVGGLDAIGAGLYSIASLAASFESMKSLLRIPPPQTIQYGSICGKWGRYACSIVRARSISPDGWNAETCECGRRFPVRRSCGRVRSDCTMTFTAAV